MADVIPFGEKPSPASGGGSFTKVSGEMSPETPAFVHKFVLQNANNTRSSHGAMTAELLVKMLRDGGDSWQGCHMAILLSEHGHVV